MSEFTASNGVKVTAETQAITGMFRIRFDNGPAGRAVAFTPRERAALVEALDAERDAELGRWRWPEHPDYVVYPLDGGAVRVLAEKIGAHCDTTREQANQTTTGYHEAARAYFDAHPEPEPKREWAEAQFIVWKDGAYLWQTAQRDTGDMNLGWWHGRGGDFDFRWFSEDKLADLIGHAKVVILEGVQS